ncbi:MAG TPA: ABC transporter substrate-binding protein [Candidatus Binatia bacterium]|jgi:ABC-type nitrate/sulfonate/bicarbonate transport system substrate-binding protein
MSAVLGLFKRVSLCSLTLLFLLSSVRAAELKKITFGYSSIGGMATGVWMTKEVGAFEKYGIQADLIYISSGPVVVQALIGGDLQGGSGASNAVINAILNGAQIVAVGGTANRPYHRLWVQPEINRLEDLRGKTLGVTRFGSITDNLTRILLRRNGLENAVTVRQMGGTPEVGAAFQQKAIAGAVTSDLRVGAHVPAKILLNFVDLGIPYSMNMIAVSRDYYRRNPETVEGMVRAYTEGVAAMNDQKDRALKVIAKYARLSDPKQIEEQYKDSVTYLERVPRVEPEAAATILEFMGKKGIPLETFFDNSIVDRMVREGFIDKLYKKR